MDSRQLFNNEGTFKVPEINTPQRPKAKRLKELLHGIEDIGDNYVLSDFKNNYNGPNPFASASKYSLKKSNYLSQCITTSKKITKKNIVHKPSNSAHRTLFSNVARSQFRNSVAPNTIINFSASTTEVKNKSSINHTQKNDEKEELFHKSSNKSCEKKKREPLQAIAVESVTNISSCSDKENDDCISNSKNFLSKTTIALINSHKDALKNIEKINLPESMNLNNELKSKLNENIEIMSKMISLATQLINNSVELINLTVNKDKESDKCNPVENFDESKDMDLRKKALVNSKRFKLNIKNDSPEISNNLKNGNEASPNSSLIQFMKDETAIEADIKQNAIESYEKHIETPKLKSEAEVNIKKSMEMYTIMKSGVKFLKTPKRMDNRDDFSTPNTQSLNLTSHNVKRQLERIYDS